MDWFKKKSKDGLAAGKDVKGTPPADVAQPKQAADFGVVDPVDAIWINAQRQHDDKFLRLAAHADNWRRAFFMALVVACIGVGGAVYIGSQTKHVPFLVEVDKLGQTVAVKSLAGADAVTDPKRLVYREMFDLIENLRTVTTDKQANNEHISRGFSRLAGSAFNYAKTELRKNPPNEVGASKSVMVKVRTALVLAGKSWQIDWEEHSYDLSGKEISVENWRATIMYDLIPASDEASIRTNPIGFTVTELSWQKVL
jgi:type IV secretion system protein TrbF